MSKERIELSESCKNLLEFSAGDLIPMLENNKKLSHVKQCAFEHCSNKNKEIYQVHVTVTRSEHDFLDAFQTEEMSQY
jgi:hypothetical protein